MMTKGLRLKRLSLSELWLITILRTNNGRGRINTVGCNAQNSSSQRWRSST